MNVEEFIEFNEIVPNWQARLIQGPAGIGKSAVVKQFAENKGLNFIDLRLSELEPSDLVGLPYLEEREDGEKITKYAEPWWWPKTGKTVLFLDEVDRCREDMQPIAMQLTLDRRAGGRNLPEGVIVFAACNGEKFMTSAIDQALMNRFAVDEFTPTVAEWLHWADKNKVHPSVSGFIRENKHMLDTPDDKIGIPNIVITTRRSWSNFGFALNNLKDVQAYERISMLAKPFVGLEAAIAFEQWVKHHYKTVTPQDIFAGKADPKNLNIVQISHVVEEISKLFMEEGRSSKERLNCLKFFMEAGNEMFAALFEALPKEAAPIIEQFDEVDQYIRNNFEVLQEHLPKDDNVK